MGEEFAGNPTQGVSGTSAGSDGRSPDIRILRFDRVDSTNRACERRISGGAAREPFVMVASEQSAGEGRRSQTVWQSPPGGLWLTMAYPIDGAPGRVVAGLGLRMGLACLRTVRGVRGGAGGAAGGARLKWPNDVVIGNRKVCGCMARLLGGTDGGAWILAAAGINACNEIDPSLAERATSLTSVTGRRVEPLELEGPLVRGFIWALTTPGIAGAMVEEANAALAGVGEPMRVRDGGALIEGELIGLGARGTPRIRVADGRVVEVGPGAESVHDG